MNDDITTLRVQLQRLKALHEEGSLDAKAYGTAKAPLERKLLDSVLAAPAPAPAPPRPNRNLIALLSQPRKACGQPELEWTIEDRNPDVRTLAMRGGEGQYFLALWRQVRPSRTAREAVRVRITNPVELVRHHEPSLSQDVLQVTEGGSIDVALGEAPVVLVVDGVGAAPPPSPSPSGS